MFDIYKQYYQLGLFTKADLDNFVLAQMLSAEDEAKILGVDAQATQPTQPVLA